MEQVEMDLVQRHPRKRLPEERDVEPCAVERDKEFRSSHRGGEVFQVVALDKGAFPRAVVHPDHGDRIPADREPCRLDVEERDRMPELAPRAPMVAWREASREVPVPPSVQRLRGPRELVLNPVPEFEGKPSWPSGRRKVVPRADPHPPQPFLGPVADARDMDERFAQHPRDRNGAPQKALAGRFAEPQKSLIRDGLMAARVRDPGARRTRAARADGDRTRIRIDTGAPAGGQPESPHYSGEVLPGRFPGGDPHY